MTSLGMTNEDRAGSRVIEAARAGLGMPKAELARRASKHLKMSLRTVNYYLDGERAMTLGAFRALYTVLGLTQQEAADRFAAELASIEDAAE